VLDFDLGGADSSPVCRKLVDRRIPFVFHTGRLYTAFHQWPHAPVVLKPATIGLISAVAGLFRWFGRNRTDFRIAPALTLRLPRQLS
jgi:hypothetical protein